MRWHIKVLRGCNVCANSFIALRAPRRATRFLPREILTVPPPPFGVSPAPRTTAGDAAPDDVPPTRQRHGPRPTPQRPTASDVPPTLQRSTASDAAPTTQPRQRCRGARAKLTAPPYASAVTRTPSDAAPDEATTNAAQRRHTRPTQQPPHEAPPQRHPQRRSTTRRHKGARAEHQGATLLPHDTPVQRHGARSKAPSRPKHNRSAWLHHDTTDEQHDTPKPDQSVTKRHGGAYRHYPRSKERTPDRPNYPIIPYFELALTSLPISPGHCIFAPPATHRQSLLQNPTLPVATPSVRFYNPSPPTFSPHFLYFYLLFFPPSALRIAMSISGLKNTIFAIIANKNTISPMNGRL